MPGDAPTEEDLRRDIELTREELGQTASELAAKADVKRRATEATQQAKERASEATHQVKDRASEVAQRGVEPIKRNPGPTAAGARGEASVWKRTAVSGRPQSRTMATGQRALCRAA